MSSSPAGPAGDGPRFAVVGAYVIDCIARTDRMPEWGESYQGESVHMAPGGKALNMAVALARMGAHVDAIGVVGDDLAGQTVVDALVKEGVGIEGLEVRPGGRTPICVCFSRTDGETAFLWHIDHSVAMDASTIHGVGRAPLETADATIITFESPGVVCDVASLARRNGGLVVLNPAPVSDSFDCSSPLWGAIDLLVPNEAEARRLLGSPSEPGRRPPQLASDLAAATGVASVVVTLGADGALVHGAGLKNKHFPAPPGTRVVDTTGASDVATAALTLRVVQGSDLGDAVREAQEIAGEVVRLVGGYDAIRRLGRKTVED